MAHDEALAKVMQHLLKTTRRSTNVRGERVIQAASWATWYTRSRAIDAGNWDRLDRYLPVLMTSDCF